MTAFAPSDVKSIVDAADRGESMYALIRDLYPICRSITGDGVRETLRRVGARIPLELHEVPTGTQVFDWTVPKEWNIRDAYVKNSAGVKVIDFKKSSLHVLSYSVPVNRRMSLTELREHLHTLPGQPDWIPYKTSYYQERWGFCLAQKQLDALEEGEYEVVVDSSLGDGHLTYGECFIPGASRDEVLVSCHVCHPATCNDNLSGIALSTHLAQSLVGRSLRYSYRFVFIPGTIGAITWLALNEGALGRIKHGLVVANVGDPGKLHYKKSRRGNAEIDRAAVHVLKHCGSLYEVLEFSPYGYDERQFCSPGIDLPMGSLTRTPWGRYPEYHTSADDLGLVRPGSLADTFATYLSVISVLENNGRFVNLNPKCEPQLGRRGLYRQMGGNTQSKAAELAMLWVLNFSDGEHTLLDIAEKADLRFDSVAEAAARLFAHGLLKSCGEAEPGTAHARPSRVSLTRGSDQ
jgi:aminopeptidase-like protein